jgi:hypothetical protein
LSASQKLPVDAVRGVVAEHETVAQVRLLDRRDRPADPRVRGGEETNVWDQQHARIEGVAAIILGEGAHPRVEATLADLLVDPLAQGAQVGKHRRPLLSEHAQLLDGAGRPIDRDPGYDLRVREVPPPAAAPPLLRAL